ncbi:hypothetical protein [Sphingomonas sp. Y38-1Y]|uniref:hypothetical protein n=1 Tax=Sphingomonas sp. Y38-1Y TaxID=3078265 RepID=UPI0028E7332C|nr:hypothetical protein [Sphingomonas sp. Y38-1Y]
MANDGRFGAPVAIAAGALIAGIWIVSAVRQPALDRRTRERLGRTAAVPDASTIRIG